MTNSLTFGLKSTFENKSNWNQAQFTKQALHVFRVNPWTGAAGFLLVERRGHVLRGVLKMGRTIAVLVLNVSFSIRKANGSYTHL